MGLVCIPFAEAQESSRSIAVGAKPLRSALVDFAVQANVSIGVPSGPFGQELVSSVRGNYTPTEALTRLLAGTGYSFQQLDQVTFRIVAAAVPIAPPVRTADIIVTGGSRPRALDRMAASATVLGQGDIAAAGLKGASDVTFDAAGLTLTNLGPGRDKLSVRGLSDGGFSGRTRAMVGIYLDDSRVAYSSPDPDIQYVDVRRVEVLRGPQGTLYGAGAISGLYRIVTNQPDLSKRSGAILAAREYAHGGEAGENFEGVANLPVWGDRAAIRVVGYRQHVGGWLDNARLGQRDTNDTVREGGRIAGLLRFADTWTVDGRLAYQKIVSTDSQYVSANVGRSARDNRVLEPHRAAFGLATVKANGRMGSGELTTTSTYLRQTALNRYDASGGFAFLGVPRARATAYDDRTDVESFAQEVRYTAIASRFPWHVGTYAALRALDTRGLISDNPDTPAAVIEYESVRRDLIREAAIFGDALFALSPKVDLSLASRLTWTRQTTRAAAFGVQSDDFVGVQSEFAISPKVELSYTAGPGAFFYLNAASGFRRAGVNSGAASILNSAVQPNREYGGDSLWSYEAGSKTAFLDQRLRVRAAAFMQYWNNVQTDQLFAAGVPFTGNVGDATSGGVEVEASAQATPALQIGVNASYTDSRITRTDVGFPARLQSGLPGAPHFSAGVSFLYRREISPGLAMSASVRSMYVGESNIAFMRQRELQIGDYTVTNARLALSRHAWEGAIYVDNLTNEWSSTYSYGNPIRFGGAGMITPLRPRLMGVELNKAF